MKGFCGGGGGIRMPIGFGVAEGFVDGMTNVISRAGVRTSHTAQL